MVKICNADKCFWDYDDNETYLSQLKYDSNKTTGNYVSYGVGELHRINGFTTYIVSKQLSNLYISLRKWLWQDRHPTIGLLSCDLIASEYKKVEMRCVGCKKYIVQMFYLGGHFAHLFLKTDHTFPYLISLSKSAKETQVGKCFGWDSLQSLVKLWHNKFRYIITRWE